MVCKDIIEDDFNAKCTDCFEIKDKDELYGSLNKVHDYDDKWMNNLFTEDDWLCDLCLDSRFKKHKENNIEDKKQGGYID